ncbi:MAG: branched-chain amino acid ABC transporter permease [Desulfovibrio sp.]|jgi:branched-chain amino acid transport system permease protein|nr:branched-chain amino acid ABC transporter permease [Desulfovibrio sp.]
MIAARRSLLSWSAFFASLAALPPLLPLLGVDGGGAVQIGVLNDIGIYLILALSLNIILGHAGIFHMGHTAFFAVGAYAAAILNTSCGWPILSALPVAGLLAALLAFLVAVPVIRLRGDYLLVVTIGVVEIVRICLVNNIFGLTGGANGIAGIGRAVILGRRLTTPADIFYLIWSFAALSVLLFSLLENSRFGRALNYIREDEVAAAGCGINTGRHKIQAFVLGAFWAGMAGTLFAVKTRLVDPESFTFSESVMLFAIVILGGAGSMAGIVLGTFLLIGLQEIFRDFLEARMLVFGAAMVAMMIFRPQGLLPARARRYDTGGRTGASPGAAGREKKPGPPAGNGAAGT